MLTELQIETIIAEICGTYRTGGSYTFEDVWNCVEKALAAHNAGAQEPVAWLTPGNDLYLENPGYDDWTPLYSHPQPMPQTDAAWCAAYAKLRQPFARLPYEALTSIRLEEDWSDARERLAYARRVAEAAIRSCEIQLQQRIAEIERIDRAKGE